MHCQFTVARLIVHLHFPEENANFHLDLELKGIVDTEACTANMMGTKLEVKMKKGEALAFDATGPHRGPGVVQGECEEPRGVLYFSFAASKLQEEGAAPVYAFAEGLKGTAKEHVTFHLAGLGLGLGSASPPTSLRKR